MNAALFVGQSAANMRLPPCKHSTKSRKNKPEPSTNQKEVLHLCRWSTHTHTRHATLWGYTVSFLQKRTRTRHATQLGSSLALADAHHATQCGSSLALAHRHRHTHTHPRTRTRTRTRTCTHTHARARARARHASQLGSSLALAQTSHAMLWGSSLALTHTSCYAMGIFSGTCAHTHTSCGRRNDAGFYKREA